MDQPRRMCPFKRTMSPVIAEVSKSWGHSASMEVIFILEWAAKKPLQTKDTCNQARLLKSWINVSFQDNKAGKETKPGTSFPFSVIFIVKGCKKDWSMQKKVGKKKEKNKRLGASLICFLIFYSKKNMCHTLPVGSAYGWLSVRVLSSSG